MSKKTTDELVELVRQINFLLTGRYVSVNTTSIQKAIDRYAAEREREARIEEVTRIRKRVGGSTVATNEYRAWLEERISALKETSNEA